MKNVGKIIKTSTDFPNIFLQFGQNLDFSLCLTVVMGSVVVLHVRDPILRNF